MSVSDALRERLGVEAAHDLEEFTEQLSSRWSENVLQTASERFDNRLQTVSQRFDNQLQTVSQRFDNQLQTVSDRFDNRLQAVTDRFDNRLGLEMAALRLEMQKGFGDLRVEVLRWSFLFWIGQVAAVAGLLTFMLSRGPR